MGEDALDQEFHEEPDSETTRALLRSHGLDTSPSESAATCRSDDDWSSSVVQYVTARQVSMPG